MSSRDDLGSLEPNLEGLEDLDRYQPLDDLEQATAKRSRRAPALSILGLLVMLLAAAAGLWYVFGTDGDDGSVPLITADREPVKVRPEKPGGLEVPHQEITVLNEPALEPSEQESRPEVLLPPPEAPLPVPPPPPELEAAEGGVPEPPAGPASEPAPAPPGPQAEAIVEAEIPPVPPLPPSVAQDQAGGASSSETGTAAQAQLAPPPLPESPPAPPASAAAPPPPPAQAEPPPRTATPQPAPGPVAAPVADGYRAQVAASRNEAIANRKVAQMRKAHADLFGPLPLQVRRVDLGDKGVWYRVQAGAFAERGQATELCDELKRRGEKDCWVVR